MFYTRKGDDGTSTTLTKGGRSSKDSPVFQALGTLDELNSLLGICYAKARTIEAPGPLDIAPILRGLQEDLFIAQAELAGSEKKLTNGHLVHLEEIIAEVSKYIENPKAFVIAGSDEFGAFLDFARSVSRRAEREVQGVGSEHAIGDDAKAYLNRLSSVLYVLARYCAAQAKVKEQNPSY